MSKQANVTLIGGFVVGAIALVVAGLLVFGSGKFLTATTKYVLFFEGSVKGLNKGAPVDFKGVRIGSVKDIQVLINPEDLSLKIPVIIEIEPRRMTQLVSGARVEKIPEKPDGKTVTEMLVEKGLRAKLQMQSLVTGLLAVDLDFYPDKPARYARINVGYPELPTIPSFMEELSKTVETIPLDELIWKVKSTLDGIERFVNSPDFQQSIVSLNKTLQEAGVLVRNADTHVEKVSSEAQKLLKQMNKEVGPLVSDMKGAIHDTRALVRNLDKRVGPVATGLEETLKTAQASLRKAETALVSVDNMMGDRSAFRYQVTTALEELTGAARSVRLVADYLEQHPEALLRGKKNNEGK